MLFKSNTFGAFCPVRKVGNLPTFRTGQESNLRISRFTAGTCTRGRRRRSRYCTASWLHAAAMPPPEDAIRRRRRRIASVIALILAAWPVLCPVPPPVHLASTLRDDDYVGFLVSLYEASRRSDRAYYKYHLNDLPTHAKSNGSRGSSI